MWGARVGGWGEGRWRHPVQPDLLPSGRQGAQPPLLGQGSGSSPCNPWAYFSGLRKRNENSRHREVRWQRGFLRYSSQTSSSPPGPRSGPPRLWPPSPGGCTPAPGQGWEAGEGSAWSLYPTLFMAGSFSRHSIHISWKPDPASGVWAGLLGPVGFLEPGTVAMAAPPWFLGMR